MRAILAAMESFRVPLDDQRAQDHVQIVFAKDKQMNADKLSPKVARAISVLWRDAGV
jgi:guanine nucleotide-binding protein G(i) subunit alpha